MIGATDLALSKFLLKPVLGVCIQVQAGQHPLQSCQHLPIGLGLQLQPVHTKGSGKADLTFIVDVPDIDIIWHTV